MTITPHGDRFCFWVSSSPVSEPRLVDMTANGGRGVCNCPDWATRCQKKVTAGGKVVFYRHPNRTVCKHIEAVHNLLSMSVVAHAVGVPVESLYQTND